MTSTVLKELIESGGVMTINHARCFARLDWLDSAGAKWRAEMGMYGRSHQDLQFIIEQLLHHYERQRHRERVGRLELRQEFERLGYVT
jgi:hypothetical protein